MPKPDGTLTLQERAEERNKIGYAQVAAKQERQRLNSILSHPAVKSGRLYKLGIFLACSTDIPADEARRTLDAGHEGDERKCIEKWRLDTRRVAPPRNNSPTMNLNAVASKLKTTRVSKQSWSGAEAGRKITELIAKSSVTKISPISLASLVEKTMKTPRTTTN